MPKINLKALSRQESESFMLKAGKTAFRARQLIHWIYEKHARTIQDITEFSKDFREVLAAQAYISNLQLMDRQISRDGTEKFLFGLEDDETIESVLIPDKDRLTLCISSQAGCAMGCKFCLTGELGLKRNLLAHEIADQAISVNRLIAPAKITNIVLMGMGEPLANFDNVVEALKRMTELMRIPPRRITLSTAGLVPGLLKLPDKAPGVNLAISLNATTDEVRNKIMPVNKTYPLRELLNACRRFPLRPGRNITFEYVLLKDVNDTPEDAMRLIRLLKGIPSKVNLIPFNPYKGAAFKRPDDTGVLNFQKILLDSNVFAFIRKSMGQDILAACGQLRAGYAVKECSAKAGIEHQVDKEAP